VSNRLLSLRSTLALVAVLAALGAIAIQATVGTAAPAPKSLHLVGTSVKKAEFSPKLTGKPQNGDRFGFGDKVSGDDTGFDRGVCTFSGGKTVCNVQFQLSRGTLSLQGFVPQKVSNTPIAVLGGTGDYDGATGTALVTNVSKKTTDINITFK
jgi:hypothetical protein